jgi:hypothetical protein
MPLQLLQIDIALVFMMVALIIMNWQLRAVRNVLDDIKNMMRDELSSREMKK